MSKLYLNMSAEASKIKNDLDRQMLKDTAKHTIDDYLSIKEVLEEDGRLSKREVISMAMEVAKRKTLFDW